MIENLIVGFVFGVGLGIALTLGAIAATVLPHLTSTRYK